MLSFISILVYLFINFIFSSGLRKYSLLNLARFTIISNYYNFNLNLLLFTYIPFLYINKALYLNLHRNLLLDYVIL